MKERLFQIFCAVNLISVIYGIAENTDNDRSYDLDALIRKNIGRYENSLRAKQHGVLQQFKFGGIDEDWKFEPSEDLLQNSSKCLGDIIYLLENIRSPWAMQCEYLLLLLLTLNLQCFFSGCTSFFVSQLFKK